MTKKKQESKEVVAKETAELATQNFDGLMDGAPEIDANDLLIPKVLCMQGLSKFVADERATMGQLVESVDCKVLAEKGQKWEFIPFYVFKTWIIFEKEGEKYEYKRQIPVTAGNVNWEWDEVVDGIETRRDMCLNYYVLDVKEVKDGMYFPYLLSFRRTSYKNGKKLESARAKFRAFNKPLCAKTFYLFSSKTENDKGTFYVMDIEEGRVTLQEELEEVKKIYNVVKNSNIKHDDSDLRTESDSAHVEDNPFMQEHEKGKIDENAQF